MADYLLGLFNDLNDFGDPRTQCFLCAADLKTTGHAQRRFDQWDQRVVLLNGTSIAYRQLTVPCCPDCNKDRLKPIEDSLAQTVGSGRMAVLALGPKLLFLWLGKIFYWILYRELLLLADRRDSTSSTIITADFLRQYEIHRFFLQQARELVELKDFQPGSLFVFDAQALPNRRLEWDMLDNVETMFIGIRVGRVALFGILGDGGGNRVRKKSMRNSIPLNYTPTDPRALYSFLLSIYFSNKDTKIYYSQRYV
jgi:hypothetical protein